MGHSEGHQAAGIGGNSSPGFGTTGGKLTIILLVLSLSWVDNPKTRLTIMQAEEKVGRRIA